MARDGTELDSSGNLAQAWGQARLELVGFVGRRVESPEVAEDIVQDVLERFLRRESDTQVDDVNAWLYRSARNAIIDHYRARRPSEPLPIEVEQVDIEAIPNAATRELAECLRPMVGQLPDIYRDAVIMVDLDGQTHQAAADSLTISVSGMKSRVQRGRAKLAELVNQCCAVSTNSVGEITEYAVADEQACRSIGEPSRR